MSHQQIPLHMHGLKDPLGLYCSEKKNKLNQTQNKQSVHHRAPATLARGKGQAQFCSPLAAAMVAREVAWGHQPQARACWGPLWKLLTNLPGDRLADCLCSCWQGDFPESASFGGWKPSGLQPGAIHSK